MEQWGVLILLILLVPLGVFVYWLACVPGRIAHKRGHLNAEAIKMCGLIGVIFWPCWIIAIIWAHTEARR